MFNAQQKSKFKVKIHAVENCKLYLCWTFHLNKTSQSSLKNLRFYECLFMCTSVKISHYFIRNKQQHEKNQRALRFEPRRGLLHIDRLPSCHRTIQP